MADSALPPPSAPADWRDALLALPVEVPPAVVWSAIAPRLPPRAAAPARRPRPVRGWAIAATLGAAVAGLLALRTLPVDRAVEASTVAKRGTAVPRVPAVATASPDAPIAVTRQISDAVARTAPARATSPRRDADRPRIAQTSGVERDAPARAVAAADTPRMPALDDLRAESARLEALAALARDDRLGNAPAMVLAAASEDRVRSIDAALSRADLDEAGQAELWAQRVAALRDLAGVEGTNRWLAASGESLQGAIALVD